jgi:transposase InsO family protein
MTGEELRDRGILQVDANTSEDWKATCDGVISWLARNGAEFTAEDVRPWIPEPPHPNAMGARFSAAVKTGVIQHLCYRKAKRAKAHARILAVYRGAELP